VDCILEAKRELCDYSCCPPYLRLPDVAVRVYMLQAAPYVYNYVEYLCTCMYPASFPPQLPPRLELADTALCLIFRKHSHVMKIRVPTAIRRFRYSHSIRVSLRHFSRSKIHSVREGFAISEASLCTVTTIGLSGTAKIETGYSRN